MSGDKLRPIPGMGPGFYESGPPLPEEVVSDGPRDFGMTCPLLKIAQYFGADYGDVLRYADNLLYPKRQSPDLVLVYFPPGTLAAIEDHADKFNRLRHGLES